MGALAVDGNQGSSEDLAPPLKGSPKIPTPSFPLRLFSALFFEASDVSYLHFGKWMCNPRCVGGFTLG
jgi:hypothetical protein